MWFSVKAEGGDFLVLRVGMAGILDGGLAGDGVDVDEIRTTKLPTY